MMTELEQLKEQLMSGVSIEPRYLDLNLGRCTIRVLSNSLILLTRLEQYFSHIVITEHAEQCDIHVIAIEKEEQDPAMMFTDWHREPGKTGRKDSICDINGGRVIRKVRTGMLFLQSEKYRLAVGPCIQNDNQIINFINNQYMTWLQQRDFLNCHAAALVKDGQAYAVAGFSGGGKSTLMLQMLENEATHFLSNDRLFITSQKESQTAPYEVPNEQQVIAAGVAKMPRINPGTIIHNPRLENMIPLVERAQYLSLPAQELWDLEQKYDVDIDALYGHNRIKSEAPLRSFLVLNWQRDSQQALGLKKIKLRERPDLLLAIMKSAGPFFQQNNGKFSTDSYGFDQEAYLDVLEHIEIFEATGKVDFKTMATYYLQQQEI
jgi:HprK-related kinase B